jgi:HNH endonuclease
MSQKIQAMGDSNTAGQTAVYSVAMCKKTRPNDVIKFAERMLGLLDRGSFVATYKYAVLLGLMDLCLEGTAQSGSAPSMITTRQLAEKVVEIYWSHTLPYKGETVLRQNTGGQAKILSDIAAFKDRLGIKECSLHQGRRELPGFFNKLVRDVEWILISMPLPRVQTVGKQEQRLLYRINWDISIDKNKTAVTQYQKSGGGPFDNRILFLPGVSDNLVMLSGLLRPLIHREWVSMVAHINNLEQSQLESFLFDRDRTALGRVKNPLRELQDNRCFYCKGKLSNKVEVDHFIPWSRYPDNGIENLVAADHKCNNNKRDFLASADHVSFWAERNRPETVTADSLSDIAQVQNWESHAVQTMGVARGIYLRLAPDVLLWESPGAFVCANINSLTSALTS